MPQPPSDIQTTMLRALRAVLAHAREHGDISVEHCAEWIRFILTNWIMVSLARDDQNAYSQNHGASAVPIVTGESVVDIADPLTDVWAIS